MTTDDDKPADSSRLHVTVSGVQMMVQVWRDGNVQPSNGGHSSKI